MDYVQVRLVTTGSPLPVTLQTAPNADDAGSSEAYCFLAAAYSSTAAASFPYWAY